MTPEEYDTLRAAMFGQRALSDWSDEELADPEEFYRWAIDSDELGDLLGEYGEPEVRRMLAEVFGKEVEEYRNEM